MGGGPFTPDRTPGESYEEGIILEDRGPGGDPTELGGLRYVEGDFKGKDATGVFSLRSGSGLSEGQHEVLDSLVHNLAENAYQEIVRTAGKVTDVIWWTDSGKTTKVREVNITRTAGKVSQVVLKQYNGAGALVQTLTGVVARSSGKVATITWTET